MINQVGVLTADLTVIIVFLIAWLWYRNLTIMVATCIYGFFMVVWHYNF